MNITDIKEIVVLAEFYKEIEPIETTRQFINMIGESGLYSIKKYVSPQSRKEFTDKDYIIEFCKNIISSAVSDNELSTAYGFISLWEKLVSEY